jgi:hypothetical protein
MRNGTVKMITIAIRKVSVIVSPICMEHSFVGWPAALTHLV